MSNLELTGADRCDSCGSQAWVRVFLQSTKQLLMCKHHFEKHEPKLRELDAMWYDERDRINAKLDVSA